MPLALAHLRARQHALQLYLAHTLRSKAYFIYV